MKVDAPKGDPSSRPPSRSMTRSPQDTASDSSAEGSAGVPSTAGRTLSDASAAPTIADILGSEVMVILTGLAAEYPFDPGRDLGADFVEHLRKTGNLSTMVADQISNARNQDLAKSDERLRALAFLGTVLKNEVLPTFEGDPNLALRFLTAGALVGSASALNALSHVFKNGWDPVEPEPTKGQTLYEASIAEGTPGSAEVRSWYAARQ
jgi:hypothetical protein